MHSPSLVKLESNYGLAPVRPGWKTWLIRIAVFAGVILAWWVLWLALPIVWSAAASPQEQALMVSFYENAELAQPGSGDRAVWEHMQSTRAWWQRLLADIAANPLTAVLVGISLVVILRARRIL